MDAVDKKVARLLFSPMDIADRPQETRAKIHIPESIQGISRESAEVLGAVEAGGIGTAVFVPMLDCDDDEVLAQEKKEYIKLMAVASQLEARASNPDVNYSLGQCLARFSLAVRREAWADLSKITVAWAHLILREYNSTIDAVCNNRSWFWLMWERRPMGLLYKDYIEGYNHDLRGVHDILMHLQRMINDFNHHSEVEIEHQSTLVLEKYEIQPPSGLEAHDLTRQFYLKLQPLMVKNTVKHLESTIKKRRNLTDKPLENEGRARTLSSDLLSTWLFLQRRVGSSLRHTS